MSGFEVMNWGEIPYLRAVEMQLELLQKRIDGEVCDTLVVCSHPRVVTVGRGTKDYDLLGWRGETVEVSRGGRATYHGPSQIVIYPIVDLSDESRLNLKSRDIHAYLRSLEMAVVEALAKIDIRAYTRSDTQTDDHGNRLEMTGVWVGDQKIAAVGVAVKKWVTYHGLALNLEGDPEAFQGIRPCGFSSRQVTSIEDQLSKKIERQLVTDALISQLKLALS
jgi:lipoyl(octanoyl) transferase